MQMMVMTVNLKKIAQEKKWESEIKPVFTTHRHQDCFTVLKHLRLSRAKARSMASIRRSDI